MSIQFSVIGKHLVDAKNGSDTWAGSMATIEGELLTTVCKFSNTNTELVTIIDSADMGNRMHIVVVRDGQIEEVKMVTIASNVGGKVYGTL